MNSSLYYTCQRRKRLLITCMRRNTLPLSQATGKKQYIPSDPNALAATTTPANCPSVKDVGKDSTQAANALPGLLHATNATKRAIMGPCVYQKGLQLCLKRQKLSKQHTVLGCSRQPTRNSMENRHTHQSFKLDTGAEVGISQLCMHNFMNNRYLCE